MTSFINGSCIVTTLFVVNLVMGLVDIYECNPKNRNYVKIFHLIIVRKYMYPKHPSTLLSRHDRRGCSIHSRIHRPQIWCWICQWCWLNLQPGDTNLDDVYCIWWHLCIRKRISHSWSSEDVTQIRSDHGPRVFRDRRHLIGPINFFRDRQNLTREPPTSSSVSVKLTKIEMIGSLTGILVWICTFSFRWSIRSLIVQGVLNFCRTGSW